MSKLRSLLDLEYVIEFHQSLLNGRIISTLDQNPIRNYHASLPILLNLLHQPNEEDVIIVDKINQILDPDHIINDCEKVIIMWNRFMRFDVFEPVEYNALELNITIKNFSDYYEEFNFETFGHIRSTVLKADTRKNFKQMIYLCLMPQKLLQPLDPIIYPFEDFEDPSYELDNSSYNSLDGLSGFELPNKTIHRPFRSDERKYDKEKEEYLNLNQLSNFIGFFRPPPEININDMIRPISELNIIQFKFHKNKYDYLFNSVYKLTTIIDKNEHWAYMHIFNNNILKVIEGSMHAFGYEVWERNSKYFTLGKTQFYIRSDAEIFFNSTKSIPIQVSPILQQSYENFKNGSSWESRLHFLNLYSQLFRGCVSSNSYSGFLSDGMMILYIKYIVNEDEEVKWDNVGRYLYWNLPCQIYEVNSIMEFINCIQDSAQTLNPKPVKEVVTKYYSEVKSPYRRICEKYYSDFQITLENLEHRLEHKKSYKMESNSVINKKYFDILNQIHSFYGRKWLAVTLDVLLNKYKLEIVLRGHRRLRNNAVVLKVKSFRKTYVIKIFDPIYSKSIVRQKAYYLETMRDCINSFIKECCAYAILQGQEFIPKIHQVGTLTSDTNQRATKVFAGENINLKGFYIIMEYIDTISLTKCWISQNECLNIQAKKALKSIHDYGISHGGITHENFLIKNSDKYKDNLKVYFIDFGCCKFSKLQTQFPNICTNKKSFNNSKKRDEANINQYFIDL